MTETNICLQAKPTVIGLVKIQDADSGEVLIDTKNAINFESMSYAIALSIANRPNGDIMQMVFGNGASSVSATGEILYLQPNVTGLSASLYNQTYAKFINDLTSQDTDTADNYIRVSHTAGQTYSDVAVTCLLDYSEPSGEDAFDNASVTNEEFVFDEIGLKTYDPNSGTGMLLSHVIFHPVQKSLNRRIQVVYTLRIVMA